MQPNLQADLRFGYSSTRTGFSAAGIAAFDDLRPAAVIRELIQNSLDAAQAAGIQKACVHFRLTSVDSSNIPGIKAYKKAFNKALNYQSNSSNGLPSQAKLITDRIADALAKDCLDVLSVIDNGVGLDDRRMNALLSDGVSAKGDQATGTYGNGHFTVVPASDLRYVLYGGVTERDQWVTSGHAVLASHFISGENHMRSADGYYIRDFDPSPSTLFRYPDKQDVPELIQRDLRQIRSEYGHGTAVIVTAFNHFLKEDPSLWEMVAQTASANFFAAIEDGTLEIAVKDNRPSQDTKPQTLNQSTLCRVLDQYKDQKRSDTFLSGKRAFDAYCAYKNGCPHTVETQAGNITVYLWENPSGTTRIDLCRNGMWITYDRSVDGIPNFYGKFAERVPFHAVLTLNSSEGGDLHDLIRKAEGPLHNSLRIKRLPRNDKTLLRNALNEIKDWIIRKTKPLQLKSFSSDDFLTLDFGDKFGNSYGGKARPSRWGTPVLVNRRPPQHSKSEDIFGEHQPGRPEPRNPGNNNPPNADRSRQRPSLPMMFQAVSRPIGQRRRRIHIECLQDCSNTELRLIADEAIDATCDRPNQDSYTPATLGNIKIGGKPVAERSLCRWDQRVIGVRLGDLAKGDIVEIETDVYLVDDFDGLSDLSMCIQLFPSAPEQSDASASNIGAEF